MRKSLAETSLLRVLSPDPCVLEDNTEQLAPPNPPSSRAFLCLTSLSKVSFFFDTNLNKWDSWLPSAAGLVELPVLEISSLVSISDFSLVREALDTCRAGTLRVCSRFAAALSSRRWASNMFGSMYDSFAF